MILPMMMMMMAMTMIVVVAVEWMHVVLLLIIWRKRVKECDAAYASTVVRASSSSHSFLLFSFILVISHCITESKLSRLVIKCVCLKKNKRKKLLKFHFSHSFSLVAEQANNNVLLCYGWLVVGHGLVGWRTYWKTRNHIYVNSKICNEKLTHHIVDKDHQRCRGWRILCALHKPQLGRYSVARF